MKKYTAKEVAKILGVDRVTAIRRIKDGSLKASIENGKYIIYEEDFNTFLETQPRYSKKVKESHQSEDVVVNVISANEAFNTYVIYLKKLMMLPKNDDTIKYILPIVENHKSLLDMCVAELKKQKALLKGGEYNMANSVDLEKLKLRNLKIAKCETKCAINRLNSILAQLEANDGSFIDLKHAHDYMANVVMYVAALNTMNGHNV